jgi:hypothetical protein
MKFCSFVLLFFLCFSCIKTKNCSCSTAFPDGKAQEETHSVEAQTKDLAEAACTAESSENTYFTKICKLKK